MRKSHPLITALAMFTVGFLYLPLVAVAVFSVNATRYGLVWRGFTLDWYFKLFHNEFILEAAWNTLVLAVVSTIVATILGTVLAIGMEPNVDIKGIAAGVHTDVSGFIEVHTDNGGIFGAGCASNALDVNRSVQNATSAALHAIQVVNRVSAAEA